MNEDRAMRNTRAYRWACLYRSKVKHSLIVGFVRTKSGAGSSVKDPAEETPRWTKSE